MTHGIKAALVNLFGKVPEGCCEFSMFVQRAEDGIGWNYSVHTPKTVRMGWDAGSKWQAEIGCAREVGKILGLIKEAA